MPGAPLPLPRQTTLTSENQLETAAGSAIKNFDHALGVHVPRARFIPVKTCGDLLLLESDVYVLRGDALVPNPERVFTTIPVVKLGEHYRKVRLEMLGRGCARLRRCGQSCTLHKEGHCFSTIRPRCQLAASLCTHWLALVEFIGPGRDPAHAGSPSGAHHTRRLR